MLVKEKSTQKKLVINCESGKFVERFKRAAVLMATSVRNFSVLLYFSNFLIENKFSEKKICEGKYSI